MNIECIIRTSLQYDAGRLVECSSYSVVIQDFILYEVSNFTEFWPLAYINKLKYHKDIPDL